MRILQIGLVLLIGLLLVVTASAQRRAALTPGQRALADRLAILKADGFAACKEAGGFQFAVNLTTDMKDAAVTCVFK